MGNGQHRNRRGARPHPLPHKHGGAGNPGRATTQLIPPVAPAGAADEEAGERAPEPALPAVSGATGDLVMAAGVDASQDVSPSTPVEAPAPVDASQRRWHGAGQAPQPALAEATPTGEFTAGEDAERAPKSVSPASRGRFERFYAPGQGPQSERVERVAPPITHTLPPVVSAPTPPATPARRFERIEREPSAGEPLDEDDGAEYTGPRGDVRGSIGALIDSLRDLFARDRVVASQGDVARCGVCYLHFPTDELTFRDEEGFYVCESCARALGTTRVPMLRRQQRQ